MEIVRAAITEPGRIKPARATPSAEAPRPAPDLLARITASGHPVRRRLPQQPDALEAAGWSEVLEEARTGDIAFAGGALLVCLTPAMTLIDVDGDPPLEALACAAAAAAGRAICRLDLTGSIGIDFPTLVGKAARRVVGAALDLALAESGVGPFERTAVNGFGFVQLVRPRARMSLPELLRADPIGAQARALLRSIERIPPPMPNRHVVPPAILAALEANPIWTAELSRRTGIVPIFNAA